MAHGEYNQEKITSRPFNHCFQNMATEKQKISVLKEIASIHYHYYMHRFLYRGRVCVNCGKNREPSIELNSLVALTKISLYMFHIFILKLWKKALNGIQK